MELFSRTVKELFEKIYNSATNGQAGLDSFLFGTENADTSAAFALDQLIKKPHGVTFRKAGENSAVRPYTPGVGQVFEVPRTSEKTPISEKLRDAVIAGNEAIASFASNETNLFRQIVQEHTVAHNVTRWKLALDTIRTGKFSPYGLNGEDIGLEINFSREVALDKTYDFTAVGAKIDTALQELYDAFVAQNGVRQNMVLIMGKKWLAQFESDSTVQKRIEANTSNILLQQNMMPPLLANTFGLYQVSRYRIPGRVAPVWICAYEPEGLFTAYKGATAQDFMPDDEAVMFALGGVRYKVLRGVDVYNDGRQVVRSVGDIVFDSFTTDDPIATYLRSSARYAFVPGDVNETARSTGTFAES
jgi:hypothetical protein